MSENPSKLALTGSSAPAALHQQPRVLPPAVRAPRVAPRTERQLLNYHLRAQPHYGAWKFNGGKQQRASIQSRRIRSS